MSVATEERVGLFSEVEVEQYAELRDRPRGQEIGFLARSAALPRLGDPGVWNEGWVEVEVPLAEHTPLRAWFDGERRSPLGAALRGTPTRVSGTLSLGSTALHLTCETAFVGREETWVQRDLAVLIGRFTPDPHAAPCPAAPVWTVPTGTGALPPIAERVALLDQIFALGNTLYAPGADGRCRALGVVAPGRPSPALRGLEIVREAPVLVRGVPTPARYAWSVGLRDTVLVLDFVLRVQVEDHTVCCAAGPPPERFEALGPAPGGGVRVADIGYVPGGLAVTPPDLPATVIATTLAECSAATGVVPWPLTGEGSIPIEVR